VTYGRESLSTALGLALSLQAAGGLAIGLLAFTSGCGSPTTGAAELEAAKEAAATKESYSKLQVVLDKVVKQSMSAQSEFSGSLLPARGTQVMSEVEGIAESFAEIGPLVEATVGGKHYSVRLSMQPGTKVKEGQVLVQLEKTNFELDVAIAKAKVDKAQADLAKLIAWERQESIDRLKAALDEANARKKLADAVHRRALTLSRQSAASVGEVERTAMELTAAEAMVVSQFAALSEAEAGPTAEEIAVSKSMITQAEAELKQRERLLEKTSIRVPYDGILTAINVYKGARVSPNTGPLFEVLDLRYVAAEVGIPESYIGKVKMQDIAQVLIAGDPKPVPGLVVGINEKVDPESRSFRIRVGVDNEHGKFKAGQFATVILQIGTIAETTVIPSAAIKFEEGQPGVFVYKDGIVERVGVTLGMSNGERIEIIDGLSEGELVVVDDPNLLSDGMSVEVRNQEILQGDA
jgi:HlyD family secretion protein